MEIGRLHANSGVDEHLCCLDAVGLDRDAWHDCADASEHLAADLPGVVASTPGIGHLGAGESPADGIDDFAAHRITIAWDARSYFAVAHLTSNYAAASRILPRCVGNLSAGNGPALISGACFCHEGPNRRWLANKLIKVEKFTPVLCLSAAAESV